MRRLPRLVGSTTKCSPNASNTMRRTSIRLASSRRRTWRLEPGGRRRSPADCGFTKATRLCASSFRVRLERNSLQNVWGSDSGVWRTRLSSSTCSGRWLRMMVPLEGTLPAYSAGSSDKIVSAASCSVSPEKTTLSMRASEPLLCPVRHHCSISVRTRLLPELLGPTKTVTGATGSTTQPRPGPRPALSCMKEITCEPSLALVTQAARAQIVSERRRMNKVQDKASRRGQASDSLRFVG